MSTLSIIVLTILASLFVLLLLAAIGTLVYVNLLLRRKITEFSTTISSTGDKLDHQFAKIETLIASIHGNEIQKAAQDFLSSIPRQAAAATRIEQATTIFAGLCKELTGELNISGSAIDRARASGLEPESYATAAPGEHFTSQSRVARSDSEALADEAADNSQSFIDDQG